MVHWVLGDIICASVGGLLVGGAITMQYSLNGRNNGCGGVIDVLTGKGKGGNFGWKFSYFAGLVLITMLIHLIFPSGSWVVSEDYTLTFFDQNEGFPSLMPWYSFIISGALIGVGMRMGKGCTSGHGLNGMPLLHKGSWVSVGLFMVFGFTMANVCSSTGFLRLEPTEAEYWGADYSEFRRIAALVLFALIMVVEAWTIVKHENKPEVLSCLLIGVVFGLGLLVSGMNRITKVLAFLTFDANWDPSLAFVMGFGVLLNLFTFSWIKKNQQTPRNGPKFYARHDVPLNLRILLGATLFGLGWGIGGLCPGPGMLNFFILNKVALWMLACCSAIFAVDYFDDVQSLKKTT